MRSKNWGVILLVIVVLIVFIYFLNSSTRENMTVDLNSASSNANNLINGLNNSIKGYLLDNNINGTLTLNSANNKFNPINLSFSLNNGIFELNTQ